ncbi:MAG: hypothetical protein N3E41_05195 [Thermofilaceae archaeon]|nr:hypothetical protein [Thermofilaceae archaeon]
MILRAVSHSEYRILKAIPFSSSFVEVAKRAGFSPSYVGYKIRKMEKLMWFRFLVDYKSIGLSSMYINAKDVPSLNRFFSTNRVPFVKRVFKAWDRTGPKIFLEVNPPLGMERRFASLLPVSVENLWIKEWEVKYVPSENLLVKHDGGSLSINWRNFLSKVNTFESGFEVKMLAPIKIDKMDLLILREKELFCFASLSEIGRKLKVPQQVVSYHFRNHLKSAWLLNYVEPKLFSFPVIYRVKTNDDEATLPLLQAFACIPGLIDAFIPHNEDRVLILIIDINPEELREMHSALHTLQNVKESELVAYIDPASITYHGLTAHLCLNGDTWSFNSLNEVLKEAFSS